MNRIQIWLMGVLGMFGMLLAMLFGLTLAAEAQEPFRPFVLHFEGEVEILRAVDRSGSSTATVIKAGVDLRAREPLVPGDVITTGRNGRLVLGLPDGSQAIIAPKTTVRVEQLDATPRTLFQLLKGKTRVQIEKLGGQPNPYRINTPTTVIAIRGTIFDVAVDQEKTEVFLLEGEVEVSNSSFPDQILRLNAGQSTRVPRLRPPLPPRDFRPGKNDGNFRLRSAPNGPPRPTQGRIASGDGPSGPAPGRPPGNARSGGSDPRLGRPQPGGFPGPSSRPGPPPAGSPRPRPGGQRP